ncbi:MAG: DUF2867 domain-containing protein, partial [Desulfatiglandaceae bacterium]
QLSRFLPKGLFGLIYWYMLYPFHQWVFKGMLRGIEETVGKPILTGPDRFAPGRAHTCAVDPEKWSSKS